MKIAMSSGHGKYISGAVGPQPWGLHEHTEAVKVVNQTAIDLRALGVDVVTYEDTVSHSQSENLDRIVDWHNAQGKRDADISIHFNSNGTTEGARGHECWYTSDGGAQLANSIVGPVCTASGLKNRGVKHTDSLAFLNGTSAPACLIETCFVNAKQDCELYRSHFGAICSAIASALAGDDVEPGPDPLPPPDEDVLFSAHGKCSYFGGPTDLGVSASEGLAFLTDVMQRPQLFLPYVPEGTSGLARRLNVWTPYLAVRWDYDITPKSMLRDSMLLARVTNPRTGKFIDCWPADWGPHQDTGRVCDLSPLCMEVLDLVTDDTVEVQYPAPA